MARALFTSAVTMACRYQHLLLALLALSQPVFASNWSEPPVGTWTTRTGIITPSLGLELKKKDNTIPADKLFYKPSPASRSFFSLGYANFGISGSSRNPTSDVDDLKYGSTTSTDFQFRFFGKYASHEFFYQRYKGYYLENTGDVVPGYDNNSPRLQIKELTTEAMGVNVIYNFHPDSYSQGSVYDLSTRAQKSGGALLGIASLNKHRVSSPSSLVLGTASGQYEGFENFRAASIYTASIGGGAGYILTGAGFYLGAQVLLSAGYEKEVVEYVADSGQFDASVLRALIRGGLGYNGKNFLAGISLNLDNNNASIAKTSVAFNTTEGAIFLGWRFENMAWPWLDRLSDRLFN